MTGPSGLRDPRRRRRGRTTVHPSILAEYEQDPIRGTISHIDLREVRLDQPIHATVIVHLVGESAGVKTGGVLSLVGREQVEALPADVPEHIDVDVSPSRSETYYALPTSPIDRVTFLDDPHETVIATVSTPRGYAELEEADALAAERLAAAEAAAEGEPKAPPKGEPSEPDSEE